jgi:hypothetical protein
MRSQVAPAIILKALIISGNNNEEGIVASPLIMHRTEIICTATDNKGSLLITLALDNANKAVRKNNDEIINVPNGAKRVSSFADWIISSGAI